MTGTVDRIRRLNMVAADDEPRARLRSDIPRLKRRARVMKTGYS
jgi:hypothetical protein